MQRRRLVRARGLATFRRALSDVSREGTPAAVRRRLVIVPTRAAAELLRQTIEQRAAAEGRAMAILPDFVTRDEWLRRMHDASRPAGPLLTRTAREILLASAARQAVRLRRLPGPPFAIRPGLVSTMLDFYDELRRRQRTTRRFVRALFGELRVERGTDRGSESLLTQTCFLASTFLAYERAVAGSGAVDEHRLRAELVARQPGLPFDDLVIAVADHPADPAGLWPADFDLAGRLEALERVSVVMTDEAHDAGFRERVERELPGIEEVRAPDVLSSPQLVVPESAPSDLVFMSRDREEEVRGVARAIRRRAGPDAVLADAVAVVFHRPLPYLYLAQQVLADARVPFQAFDALPLAGESYAALLDQVLTVARTGGTREAVIAVLRSGLLDVRVDGVRVDRRDTAALDAVLADRRVTTEASTYPGVVDAAAAAGLGRIDPARAGRAARAAAAVAAELDGTRTGSAASAQVRVLEAFLRGHELHPRQDDPWAERHRRARAAVLAVLDDLATACARYDDAPRPVDDIASLVHRAIEQRTFTPHRGHGGVHLVDRTAARFGEFAETFLVGLVEPDWSERQRRNVFYSSGLLKALGWPQDTDLARAEQAAFTDMLSLARDRTRLSAFQLEGDSAVAISPLVELARGLSTVLESKPERGGLFADEILTGELPPAGLDPLRQAWLTARWRRPPLDDPAYAGTTGTRASSVYRVSRVDRYVTCPFKYFAEFVLGLPEERDEMSGLTPLERGTFLHALFERFYERWQQEGHGAIEPGNLADALALFRDVARDALERIPAPDRVLEEMRLLGSLVTRGVSERVFELEVGAGRPVARRLLEFGLDGPFIFPVRHGLSPQTIAVRGKADRIDVLEDGSIRVVDYKLGRLPDLDVSVQVAVYAHCARQRLEAEDGSPHPVAAASYLAFGDDRRFEGRLGSAGERASDAVETRASEFAGAVSRIEAGEFPPRPHRVSACTWCGYAGVCRKEYRIEDDEAADAL